MSKGVVWYDNVALNFKAWLGGVLTTVPVGSGSGDVVGPASAVANNLASYNGTTGKLIKDAGVSPSSFATLPIDLTSSVTGVLPPSNFYTEVTFTTTGNIDDLNFSNANLIRMNNATDATIRGLLAGIHGQIVTIVSIGAGNVFLANQNAGSSAGNRLINTVTSGNTPLAAGSGMATYQYDDTTDKWRLITHEQGAYINVAFNAGDFTANGAMTWTVQAGDVGAFKYLLQGKTLTVVYLISTTTVGGTPNTSLLVAIPNGFSASGVQFLLSDSSDNGGGATVSLSLVAGGAQIFNFYGMSSTLNWSLATNATAINSCSLSFEVQ